MFVLFFLYLFRSFLSFFYFFSVAKIVGKNIGPRVISLFFLFFFFLFFFIQLDKNVSSFFSFIRNHPYIGFQCQHLFEYFIFSFNFVWKTLFLANDLFVKLVNRFYILNRVDLSRQNSINDVEYELCIFLNAYPHKKKKKKNRHVFTIIQIHVRACVCVYVYACTREEYIYFFSLIII